jgi:hypothetical protein
VKKKKSHGVRPCEYGAQKSVGICFVAKNWQILWDYFGKHTFFMSRFVVKICLTFSLPTLNPSATILMFNGDLFSQKSSHFPFFLQFSSLTDEQAVRHLLFLLQTSCAIQTHELFKRYFLRTPHEAN